MKVNYKKISPVISVIVVLAAAFLMYKLNALTTLRSDDFNYHYSFADGTRLSSFMEVVKSQAAHYKVMNGRIPAHFLMQLSTLFGKSVFDVANTIVYIFFILLVLYMIKKSWKVNPLTFMIIFVILWFYLPAFGSTVLWWDGAFNYLWTTVICLIALLPYRNPKLYDYKVNQFIFPIIGLIAGWCSETTSAGIVFFQFWFIVYWLYNKRKHVIPYVITMFASFGGYCLMTFAPGQMQRLNRVSGGEIPILKNMYHFIVAMGSRYYLEIIIFILLLSISIFLQRNKELNYLAILFFATAILASCTLIMAGIQIINERTYFGIETMIVIAMGILVKNIFADQLSVFQKMNLAYVIILVPLFLINYRAAYVDVRRTYNEYNKREVYIEEQKKKGEKELNLNAINSTNDHSPYYLTPDLSPNPNHWQNVTKSKYYGVDKINKVN
ncbi:DUF3329 domain-containing protein [Vagococcus bubulae]|uniref:Uncharacterized protein n=1 Tax=Vagococcus bubulae TaxID=1977868 RepID=A0A429ZR69_9ENTE|nr:DUF6056 family protein [Vagococcus bubulae]RST96161.1 hypothetical protein CBF36_00045 [Vagococcus bubulae]